MDWTDSIQNMVNSCGQGGNISVIWLVGNFLSNCGTVRPSVSTVGQGNTLPAESVHVIRGCQRCAKAA
jgi:hypothetical protein